MTKTREPYFGKRAPYRAPAPEPVCPDCGGAYGSALHKLCERGADEREALRAREERGRP